MAQYLRLDSCLFQTTVSWSLRCCYVTTLALKLFSLMSQKDKDDVSFDDAVVLDSGLRFVLNAFSVAGEGKRTSLSSPWWDNETVMEELLITAMESWTDIVKSDSSDVVRNHKPALRDSCLLLRDMKPSRLVTKKLKNAASVLLCCF